MVVVTYNNLELTRTCLASLDALSDYPALELIVVDNASGDGSPAFLAQWAAQGQALADPQ
ncbi:MAG: glycosyltransferase [Burkholderiaceae bacterium]